jgi:hypothetical protein
MAFTSRLIDYLSEGHWGQAATKAFEFAPDALTTHALFGMALIPLFFLQPPLGMMLMGEQPPGAVRLARRWQGRLLALAAGVLSLLGLYITYTFAANSDSVTSVVFMLLVALFVILFFAQAAWEARKHRIGQHLDALVFAMIFLSVPATGRLIEALMRAGGVENTRPKELMPMGGGYQVELVDITILLVAAVPIFLWSVCADPTRRLPEVSGEAMDRQAAPWAAACRSGHTENHTLKAGTPCIEELPALFDRLEPFSSLSRWKRRIETDADQGLSGAIIP